MGIQLVESAKDKKEKADIEELENSLIEDVETSYEAFINDDTNDLSDEKYIISSKQTASSILTSKAHNEYISAYQRAEQNGLSDEEVIKEIHQNYLKVISYLEAVENVMEYSEAVKEYSNGYTTLLTEQQHNHFGMNDLTITDNVRGKALSAIDSYKKWASNNARTQSLDGIYHDTNSYVMASYHIHLASSQDLKTDKSITEAESLIKITASNLEAISDTISINTITEQMKAIQNKITQTKQLMVAAQQSKEASSNQTPKKTETAKVESKPATTNQNKNTESEPETTTSKDKTEVKKTETAASENKTQTQAPALTSGSVTQFEKEVVNLVNVERSQEGVPALSLDAKLSQVAKTKSEDMQKNNYFNHTSPTYGSPFDMMKRFGIGYTAAAENIAKGQSTPVQVVNAWMNSPGHRGNILNAKFTHIGVGHSVNGNYWSQMFIKK